ncbi:Histone-lysine N-methyltransferase set9 [Puccinia graminis f. sp. tritici]|uniref:Histone-lysine N-methyltransferase set9 n=1 Tax=Puccinia graminis f. sp. tritici TaxID=56615 RepID=A0A5B0NEK9_PUCGR|nr:Histone-lysine N-methyltransferase set9 [Puccinia graminis f. sp. tritici]
MGGDNPLRISAIRWRISARASGYPPGDADSGADVLSPPKSRRISGYPLGYPRPMAGWKGFLPAGNSLRSPGSNRRIEKFNQSNHAHSTARKCGIRFCETDRYLVGQVASTTGSPSTCTSSISPKLHSRPRRAVVKERQPKPASRPRRKPRSFPAALDTPSEHSGSLSPVPTPRLIPSHRSNDNIPRDIQPKDDPASSAKSPSTNGHRLLVLSIG